MQFIQYKIERLIWKLTNSSTLMKCFVRQFLLRGFINRYENGWFILINWFMKTNRENTYAVTLSLRSAILSLAK